MPEPEVVMTTVITTDASGAQVVGEDAAEATASTGVVVNFRSLFKQHQVLGHDRLNPLFTADMEQDSPTAAADV